MLLLNTENIRDSTIITVEQRVEKGDRPVAPSWFTSRFPAFGFEPVPFFERLLTGMFDVRRVYEIPGQDSRGSLIIRDFLRTTERAIAGHQSRSEVIRERDPGAAWCVMFDHSAIAKYDLDR